MSRIIGHVDGFRADVLQGWIANLDEPSRPEQFIARDDQCRDVVLSPNFFRADVCSAHHINGLFGFGLKRSWLDPRSKTVTILTRDGTALPGGTQIALPKPPAATPPPGPVNVFLHLAKTGGTSVRHALMQHFSEGETLLLYPGAPFTMEESCIETMPLFQRQRLRLVIGHCSYGVHERLGVPSRYSVFLRDPATRLRSNFAHHGAAGTVFHAGGRVVSRATAMNDSLSEEFDNLMVRVIAGLSRDEVPVGCVSSADVDSALDHIREHFAFVGLSETMDASFAGLCQTLGIASLAVPRDNVTPDWMTAEQETASVRWDAVFERNRHDFALYDAVQKYGLVGRH